MISTPFYILAQWKDDEWKVVHYSLVHDDAVRQKERFPDSQLFVHLNYTTTHESREAVKQMFERFKKP